MHQHPAIRTLELSYGLIGLILTGWALIHIPTTWYTPLLALIGGVALMTPFSVRLNDPVKLPAAMPLEIATLLLAPPEVAIVIAGCTNLLTSLWFRRPLSRTLFNVANLVIPNALGGLILVLLMQPWPRPLYAPADLPVIALVTLVRMVTNLLGTALLQYTEGKIRRYWAWVHRSLVEEWYAGGFGIRILPVLMAFAFPAAGWWALVLGTGLQFAIGGSMQRYQDRIDQQSLVDALTGLGSRKAWEQYTSGPKAESHTVAVIDVNGLKRTNDTYGHTQGDAILTDLAERLRSLEHRFPESRAFRIGGDEFVVTLPGSLASESFPVVLEQILEEYRQYWWVRTIRASASVGFASAPTEAPDLAAAFSLADGRMYQAKPQASDGDAG
ncbi:MAG: GGDEF domain-containing protein [Bacillota bacterium]